METREQRRRAAGRGAGASEPPERPVLQGNDGNTKQVRVSVRQPERGVVATRPSSPPRVGKNAGGKNKPTRNRTQLAVDAAPEPLPARVQKGGKTKQASAPAREGQPPPRGPPAKAAPEQPPAQAPMGGNKQQAIHPSKTAPEPPPARVQNGEKTQQAIVPTHQGPPGRCPPANAAPEPLPAQASQAGNTQQAIPPTKAAPEPPPIQVHRADSTNRELVDASTIGIQTRRSTATAAPAPEPPPAMVHLRAINNTDADLMSDLGQFLSLVIETKTGPMYLMPSLRFVSRALDMTVQAFLKKFNLGVNPKKTEVSLNSMPQDDVTTIKKTYNEVVLKMKDHPVHKTLVQDDDQNERSYAQIMLHINTTRKLVYVILKDRFGHVEDEKARKAYEGRFFDEELSDDAHQLWDYVKERCKRRDKGDLSLQNYINFVKERANAIHGVAGTRAKKKNKAKKGGAAATDPIGTGTTGASDSAAGSPKIEVSLAAAVAAAQGSLSPPVTCASPSARPGGTEEEEQEQPGVDRLLVPSHPEGESLVDRKIGTLSDPRGSGKEQDDDDDSDGGDGGGTFGDDDSDSLLFLSQPERGSVADSEGDTSPGHGGSPFDYDYDDIDPSFDPSRLSVPDFKTGSMPGLGANDNERDFGDWCGAGGPFKPIPWQKHVSAGTVNDTYGSRSSVKTRDMIKDDTDRGSALMKGGGYGSTVSFASAPVGITEAVRSRNAARIAKPRWIGIAFLILAFSFALCLLSPWTSDCVTAIPTLFEKLPHVRLWNVSALVNLNRSRKHDAKTKIVEPTLFEKLTERLWNVSAVANLIRTSKRDPKAKISTPALFEKLTHFRLWNFSAAVDMIRHKLDADAKVVQFSLFQTGQSSVPRHDESGEASPTHAVTPSARPASDSPIQVDNNEPAAGVLVEGEKKLQARRDEGNDEYEGPIHAYISEPVVVSSKESNEELQVIQSSNSENERDASVDLEKELQPDAVEEVWAELSVAFHTHTLEPAALSDKEPRVSSNGKQVVDTSIELEKLHADVTKVEEVLGVCFAINAHTFERAALSDKEPQVSYNGKQAVDTSIELEKLQSDVTKVEEVLGVCSAINALTVERAAFSLKAIDKEPLFSYNGKQEVDSSVRERSQCSYPLPLNPFDQSDPDSAQYSYPLPLYPFDQSDLTVKPAIKAGESSPITSTPPTSTGHGLDEFWKVGVDPTPISICIVFSLLMAILFMLVVAIDWVAEKLSSALVAAGQCQWEDVRSFGAVNRKPKVSISPCEGPVSRRRVEGGDGNPQPGGLDAGSDDARKRKSSISPREAPPSRHRDECNENAMPGLLDPGPDNAPVGMEFFARKRKLSISSGEGPPVEGDENAKPGGLDAGPDESIAGLHCVARKPKLSISPGGSRYRVEGDEDAQPDGVDGGPDDSFV